MNTVFGQKIYLKPFAPEHVEDPQYFAWLNDYEVVRFIGREEYLGKFTVADLREYVEQLWANPYASFFAVYATDTDAFIGTTKINFMSEKQRRSGVCDVGIMIGSRAYWGKGLSTDILRTVSAYAFDELGARKLGAGAYSLNVPVIRAFLRVGYKEEGRLREQLAIDDSYCEHVLLGCFAHELVR